MVEESAVSRSVEMILDQVTGRPEAQDARLIDVRVGPYWSVVRTSVGTGLASTMSHEADRDHGHPIADAGRLHERTPLELAELLRAPSAPESALGLAAVNALAGPPAGTVSDENALAVLRERAGGRLLALVGHFPFVDDLRAVCRELWVFERGSRRRPDDLGQEHMQELVPHAEVVAITGTTLLNGTLDGIVRLVKPGAFLMMLGPSTPLIGCLFEIGFDALCGTLVQDEEAVVRAVSQGAVTGQIPGVRRICLWRDD
jgi:uncharacterized protein (DUF4213/DUF364 family)